MYWQEVPYRSAAVLRAAMQRLGLGTAEKVPPARADAGYGRSWCRAPQARDWSGPLLEASRKILDGKLSVFGQAVAMPGGLPDWLADPVTGRRLPLSFGLFLDFRHVPGLDIKHLWEVNRLLWWVPLAQAWALQRDQLCLELLGRLLDDWLQSNPYALGPNWSSPVEHGIRLINWSLVWHLVGGEKSPLFDGAQGRIRREKWLACIYQHMRFASDNYSFYSSADNHLIGEAAGVFVAAHTWNLWPDSLRLRKRAKRLLEDEAAKQFSSDGVNREQALCYHKFSLQFLFASGLCGRANDDDFSGVYWDRLKAAVCFLGAVTDVAGQLPRIGDSDDGDVWRLATGGADGWHELLSIGARVTRHPALTAKCRALGPHVPQLADWLAVEGIPNDDDDTTPDVDVLPASFLEGGYVLLGHHLHGPEELRVLVDCGPLGYNRIAGHAHADALSVLVSAAGEELLVDAGTYCYNAAPELRRYFRGTSAHNTLTVDGLDQAPYGASFLWLKDVSTTVIRAEHVERRCIHAWHDGYMSLRDPVRHHRRVDVEDDGKIRVQDWLECRKPHEVALRWHSARGVNLRAVDGENAWQLDGQRRGLSIRVSGVAAASQVVYGQDNPRQGWVSNAFYQIEPAPVIEVRASLEPGQVLTTIIDARVIRAA